jgi:nitrate reductase delta subunit
MICGQSELLEQERAAVADEERDDTPEAMDREWEESAVTFSGADACDTNSNRKDPIQQQALHWVDPLPNVNKQLGGQIT